MSDSNNEMAISPKDVTPLVERSLNNVREEMQDNPYIVEALRVLPVGGYRSAIGSFWNAVVDDLRNKIIHRSLEMFNKTMSLRQTISTYEDFQNHVNDDELIEGAYKIGVIGWEASKVLRHAKETRHIFDGHPRSSDPSIVKVLAMIDDCTRYVLNADYPPQMIDIDEYLTTMGDTAFDRNQVAIESALGDLPDTYKIELTNRLFSAYIHPDSSTTLKSNIEFVAPILWQVLSKKTKVQIVRRVDQEISRGNRNATEQAFEFVNLVDGARYLSTVARKCKIEPLVASLKQNLDNWTVEDECVEALEPYAPFVPDELISDYVSALTHTYVGKMGSSNTFSRTDFYANGASLRIPKMFEAFDDNAADAFVQCIVNSRTLRNRIQTPAKLRRLRSLAHIVFDKTSAKFSEAKFLELLVDEDNEADFKKLLQQRQPHDT